MSDPGDERVFQLLLIAKPGDNPIRAIRWLLKIALRRFQLRCIDLREAAPPPSQPQPERTREHEHLGRTRSEGRLGRGDRGGGQVDRGR